MGHAKDVGKWRHSGEKILEGRQTWDTLPSRSHKKGNA